MTTLLQDSSSENPRFAIVVSRFNADITDSLLAGAQGAFSDAGLPANALSIHFVPGAFELPFLCDQLAKSGNFSAILFTHFHLFDSRGLTNHLLCRNTNSSNLLNESRTIEDMLQN